MPDDPLRLVDAAAAIAAIFVAVVVGIYGFTHRRKVTAQWATLEFIAQYEVHNPGMVGTSGLLQLDDLSRPDAENCHPGE